MRPEEKAAARRSGGASDAGSSTAADGRCILTLNGGSSSIRFALYRLRASPLRRFSGKLERIGLPDTQLSWQGQAQAQSGQLSLPTATPDAAVDTLLAWLATRIDWHTVAGVGHRVVHGLDHAAPALISAGLLAELRSTASYDPEHMPAALALIETLQQRYPGLPQVACFDTAFHHNLPRVAQLFAIPRRFSARGVRRYGFHGLSYAYAMEVLAREAGAASAGRVILAHLGNGASLAAVAAGRSLDTTMGFTPAGGLPMGTRSGDLDPGLICHLMQSENLSSGQLNHLINRESGLLAISGTSSDMRDLLKREATDVGAAEAIEYFCYQTRKSIGAFTAVLGGLDMLVFTGGIGENAAEVRTRICAGLGFLGIELAPDRNKAHASIISSDASTVTVRVIHTDEELMIARAVSRMLDHIEQRAVDPAYEQETPDV